MHDPSDALGDRVEAPERTDPPLYPVAPGSDQTTRCVGLELPRRPGAGRRGVLLVDDPGGFVYVLDADDDAGVFRGRARRPIAGATTDLDYPGDGSDHVVRAAYETDYDVIAAPWAGDDQGEAPATARVKGKRRGQS
jgi:hypothetical protein